jgi:UPF0716 protein FxsA
MFFRLFLLFTLVPLIELAILIKIGQRIGVLETIALIILAGIVGAWLARREGLRVITDIRADLAARRLPHDRLIDALLILIASLMLIFPGVLSDVFAIVLLLPPTRAVVRRLLKNRFQQRFMIVRSFRQPPDDQNFIDV